MSRDFATLAEHNIITYETDGRAKRPALVANHVVVEPIVCFLLYIVRREFLEDLLR